MELLLFGVPEAKYSYKLFIEDALCFTRADLIDATEKYVAFGAGLAKPWELILSQGIPLISA